MVVWFTHGIITWWYRRCTGRVNDTSCTTGAAPPTQRALGGIATSSSPKRAGSEPSASASGSLHRRSRVEV